MLEALNMDRRALMGHALLLAGATAAAGFSEDALARAARKPRRLLGRSAFALLSAFADTIIPVTDTPGALAANVPALVDAMLANWAAPATRDEVIAALGRMDAAATAQKGKAFAALTAAERTAFLTDYDRTALKPVPPPPGAKSANPFAPIVSVTDNGYHRTKGLVVALFLSSEVALTHEQVYEHVPGTWVPSLKITPGMRPFAGVGPF